MNLLSHLSGWVVKGCRRDTSTDKPWLWISENVRVGREYPAHMNIENQLSQLQSQLRKVRISKGLTLSQVSILSKGTISAIALGSYERGDRSISAVKLLEIAQLYQVPVSELMSPTEKGIRSGRVIIDVNKLANNPDDSNDAALKIIQRIAHLRHDWNGQVISLRSSDIDLLKIFANYSDEQTNNFLDSFALAKLK